MSSFSFLINTLLYTNIYPSFLLNVLPARVNVIKAITSSGIILAVISAIPIPFKKIPRVKTIKNRTGFNHVKYCKNIGISSIGEINPDKSTAGIINVIADSIACCWVLQIADIYSPTPTIASSEIKIEIKNNINDPANGIISIEINGNTNAIIILLGSRKICFISFLLRQIRFSL